MQSDNHTERTICAGTRMWDSELSQTKQKQIMQHIRSSNEYDFRDYD
jgi:hypothetical protein